MLSKTLRDKLVKQATEEIAFARRHKQSKVKRWQQNENLLYGVKPANVDSRANVDLGRMAEFINSYLSKIDNPLQFKYAKRKESQLRRVLRLNALRDADASVDFWDMKDLAGKKQCLVYGRSIFGYHADSMNGYKAYLENVDVYDYLIDPAGGGIDIEKARYMGRYGVVKDRSDLEKNESYIKAEVTPVDEGKIREDVIYGHLNEIYAKPGDISHPGTILGTAGNTGPVYAGGDLVTRDQKLAGSRAGTHLHGPQIRKCKKVKAPDGYLIYDGFGPYRDKDGFYYEIVDYENGLNGCIDPTPFWTGMYAKDAPKFISIYQTLVQSLTTLVQIITLRNARSNYQP